MSVGDVCKKPNLCLAAWKYVSARSIFASDNGGVGSVSRLDGTCPSGMNTDDVHEANAHTSS